MFQRGRNSPISFVDFARFSGVACTVTFTSHGCFRQPLVLHVDALCNLEVVCLFFLLQRWAIFRKFIAVGSVLCLTGCICWLLLIISLWSFLVE